MNVSDIRNILKEKYKNKVFVVDKTGAMTVEIINASFIVDEETIFGTLNEDWSRREIEWYESQSLYVADIPEPIPAIWKQVASSNGTINSNYGWCIFSEGNHNQYDHVIKALKENVDTRRANMIYNRPSMQIEYNANGMCDFMCTNNVQYFIRDNKLVTIVSMRSNDAVFGFKGDYYWQKYVVDKMIADLHETYPGITANPIMWNAHSLHVYERHFSFLED